MFLQRADQIEQNVLDNGSFGEHAECTVDKQ